jgi:DNA-binding MarR family transcriptional regulator
VVIVIVIVIWRRRTKVTESVVLALIRSKDGATLDDIILGAHISSDEAVKVVRRLLAKGVIRVERSEGNTVYKVS